MTINQMCAESHKIAAEKGWWDKNRGVPEMLALIHSEVSEALEEWREGRIGLWYEAMAGPNPQPLKPCGLGIELADTVIRIGDICASMGINLEKLITEKMAYNRTRPHRHGGKAG